MISEALVVNFIGPFSWPGFDRVPSIFQADIGRSYGIYLWAIATIHGEVIYYIGETGTSFAQRMHEHFNEHVTGGYHLYAPAEFVRGNKVVLWNGMYGPNREKSPSDFVRRYAELVPVMAELVSLYRFYLAPLECDKRTRERIEAALARHLNAQPGIIGAFQDPGIRYRGRRSHEPGVTVSLACGVKLLGLPDSLVV